MGSHGVSLSSSRRSATPVEASVASVSSGSGVRATAGAAELWFLSSRMRSRYLWDFLTHLIDSSVRPGWCSISIWFMPLLSPGGRSSRDISRFASIQSASGSHRALTRCLGRFSAWKTSSWARLLWRVSPRCDPKAREQSGHTKDIVLSQCRGGAKKVLIAWSSSGQSVKVI